jgi:hypothetical protein
MVARVEESCHESASFSEKDMPELQDRATQGRRVRDLQGKEAQAAPGVMWCSFQAFTGFLDSI